MGQDQLFKTILERLLRDFLELFFPDAAARLDFETLRFVGKEVFANVPEGKVREADVVARLETRNGEPELVLVHVEVEAEPKSDFPRRMFEYYALAPAARASGVSCRPVPPPGTQLQGD